MHSITHRFTTLLQGHEETESTRMNVVGGMLSSTNMAKIEPKGEMEKRIQQQINIRLGRRSQRLSHTYTKLSKHLVQVW